VTGVDGESIFCLRQYSDSGKVEARTSSKKENHSWAKSLKCK